MNMIKYIRSLVAVVAMAASCAFICPLRAADSLVAMFWNVENFFDTFDDPAKSDDEFTPRGEKRWTWRKYYAKRNAIAKTIISSKGEYGQYPSIVGFCEVENRNVMWSLVNETPLVKLGYQYIHRESMDRRGIDVSFIYRESLFYPLKVENIQVSLPDTSKSTRSILYVKGYSKELGDTLHIFVNHWPSKLGGAERSLPNRMATAAILRNKCDSIFVSAEGRKGNKGRRVNIIAMGDFNDTPYSEPLLLAEDSENAAYIINNKATNFHNDRRGSLKYQGVWEMIDQFLVSNTIDVKSRMSIYSPRFLLHKDEKFLGFKPFRTYQGPKYLGGASDHLPIMLIVY